MADLPAPLHTGPSAHTVMTRNTWFVPAEPPAGHARFEPAAQARSQTSWTAAVTGRAGSGRRASAARYP
jgi:hypothetical protein